MYEVVRKATWGVSCYINNFNLFMRTQQLADCVGKEDEFFDEFKVPKQIPVVKEKKIYPNAPCPCGSGKKYKKCCGK